MLFVTDRHNVDDLSNFLHFIKGPILARAEFPRRNRIIAERFTVLSFKIGLIHELLANIRYDDLAFEGAIVRKVNLRILCNYDPVASHPDEFLQKLTGKNQIVFASARLMPHRQLPRIAVDALRFSLCDDECVAEENSEHAVGGDGVGLDD